MHHVIGATFAGVAAGTVVGNRTQVRPVVRCLVKCGIIAKRRIQAVAATAIAETHKLVEEARADLDQAGMEHQN